MIRSRAGQFPDLERVFEECGFVVPKHARERAAELAIGSLGRSGATGIADVIFATELFGGLAVELASDAGQLSALIDRIEHDMGMPRVALGREVLRVRALLELPSAVGIEVQLALLLGFLRATAVSLWTLWPAGELRHIAHAGDLDIDAAPTRQAARQRLEPGTRGTRSNGLLATAVVERWQQPSAVVVARFAAESRTEAAILLDAAVPMLTTMLERDQSMRQSEMAEESLVAAAERRLARLRFDLHDGPQQDVVLLADDLKLFRGQLQSVVDGNPAASRIVGRVDDLQARLIALDGDLRRISATAQAPITNVQPLEDALAQLTDSLGSRSGIETELRLRGTLTGLTDSQRIALMALVREALNNVRDHSGARHVSVDVVGTSEEIVASVTDDGRGFDPEQTLVRAAREGHLGLVGMHERMRLLGGRTTIDSRPGGPTVISVSLPRGTVVAPPPSRLPGATPQPARSRPRTEPPRLD
jgi:signal transduction histidine kinase